MSSQSDYECSQLRGERGKHAGGTPGEFLHESVSSSGGGRELQSGARAGRTDSPSNRIQITFPPSPSAEALCGHGTPPCGVTIISYGPLKAARSRTEKSGRVIAAVQTIVRCKQRALLTKRGSSRCIDPIRTSRDALEKDRQIADSRGARGSPTAPRRGKKWKRTYRDRSFSFPRARSARAPPPALLPSLINRGGRRCAAPPSLLASIFHGLS
jgi:hypothetical protein